MVVHLSSSVGAPAESWTSMPLQHRCPATTDTAWHERHENAKPRREEVGGGLYNTRLTKRRKDTQSCRAPPPSAETVADMIHSKLVAYEPQGPGREDRETEEKVRL